MPYKRDFRLMVLFMVTALVPGILLTACVTPPKPENALSVSAHRSTAQVRDAEAGGDEMQPITGVTSVSDGSTISHGTLTPDQANSGAPSSTSPKVDTTMEADETGIAKASSMETYTDDTYGFTIVYPKDYRQLTTNDITKYVPLPTTEVQFFPLAAVENNATSYAPPTLAVRTYLNSEGLELREWIDAHDDLNVGNEEVATVTIGEQEGVKLCRATNIAPSCTVFVARRGAILQFIPLGLGGDLLLRGVTFVP